MRLMMLIWMALIGSMLLAATPADQERAKIEATIVRVEKSDVKFIRNGTEHTAVEAASHMRDKLKLAGSDVKTFDDFIEKVASKSSLTGKPYLVKLPDGKTIEAAKWLREGAATKPS